MTVEEQYVDCSLECPITVGGDKLKDNSSRSRFVVGDRIQTIEKHLQGMVIRADRSSFPYLVDLEGSSNPTWLREKDIEATFSAVEKVQSVEDRFLSPSAVGEAQACPDFKAIRQHIEHCFSDESLERDEVLNAKLRHFPWLHLEVLLSCPTMQTLGASAEEVRSAIPRGGSSVELRQHRGSGRFQVRRAGGAPPPRLGHILGKPVAEYNIGDKVDGVVTTMTNFGVFFNIGCVRDGLLRLDCWKVCNFSRGDEVPGLLVCHVDLEKRNIGLSYAGDFKKCVEKERRPTIGDRVWVKTKRAYGNIAKDDKSAVPYVVNLVEALFPIWCKEHQVQMAVEAGADHSTTRSDLDSRKDISVEVSPQAISATHAQHQAAQPSRREDASTQEKGGVADVTGPSPIGSFPFICPIGQTESDEANDWQEVEEQVVVDDVRRRIHSVDDGFEVVEPWEMIGSATSAPAIEAIPNSVLKR